MLTPPDCRIVKRETPDDCFEFRLECPLRTRLPEEPVGVIKACGTGPAHNTLYNVEWVYVQPQLRQNNFATLLYEAAAKEACRRAGRLASFQRDPISNSNAFWVKQERKGRASRHPVRDGSNRSDVFILKCSDQMDLRGLKKKPAWVR